MKRTFQPSRLVRARNVLADAQKEAEAAKREALEVAALEAPEAARPAGSPDEPPLAAPVGDQMEVA